LPTIGAGGQLVLPGTTVFHPTPYRYSVLVERAKQLVQLAGQVEAAMLAAVEKEAAQAYTLLKAKQDLGLARAGVQLKDLQITEANDSVTLATLQQARAKITEDHYQKLLDEGLSELERNAIGDLEVASFYQATAADLQLSVALYYGAKVAPTIAAGVIGSALVGPEVLLGALGSIASDVTAGLGALSGAFSGYAAKYSIQANIQLTLASFERRQQDWDLQESLAKQDFDIGGQQIQIANDQVQVAQQERAIAGIQADNAQSTVDFLTNQFPNVSLYDWMSGILEQVYSFFLRQATAMARLAQDQLAFERQDVPPAFIQADYWEAPTDGSTAGDAQGKAPDRRGLTGSARLLQDIYQLDQYAFQTNQRKLQLLKTISLARLAPAEFQRFRETGVMTFATPMEMVDRDFPGHYLRLIKRVRTSVVALIPPTEGIHATLSTTGLSRVVIGGDIFQTVPIRRDPESVALSAPINATGLFELDPQSDMLLPFESSGVDTTWEFRMPKAGNLFDYSTIADVLITIEYTALNSFEYRQQVIQALNPMLSADRPFSFRLQFADQWYDLHNPDQTSTPMTVRFTTVREDFPPNLDDLKIQQVVLYFARADGQSFEVPVTHLHFTEQGSSGLVGGSATSIDGVISTRRGNAGIWAALIGKGPIGDWELALPKTDEMKSRFGNEEIGDILLVITFSGRTPQWPA
jgi:hypothetical protein